jgi:hypothetical protein
MKRLCLLVLLLTVAACGCKRGGKVYVPVTGTLKYADGSALKGVERLIAFQPNPMGPDTKVSSSAFGDDGQFSLRTIKPGDGAVPGDYLVTVQIFDSSENRKSMVANKFTSVTTTPLKATVTVEGENHFDFVVEKP